MGRFFAILSGVKFGDAPGAGTFYDFPSLTAILDGIHPETVFISVTTYTCLLPPTQKVIALFFFCRILPQNITSLDFWESGSE